MVSQERAAVQRLLDEARQHHAVPTHLPRADGVEEPADDDGEHLLQEARASMAGHTEIVEALKEDG